MLLQEIVIPDNVAYLVLGLAALAVILGGWVISYFWRARGLRRDAALLAQMELQEAEQSGSPAARSADAAGGAETSPPSARVTS
jgi:hypothetical protein